MVLVIEHQPRMRQDSGGWWSNSQKASEAPDDAMAQATSSWLPVFTFEENRLPSCEPWGLAFGCSSLAYTLIKSGTFATLSFPGSGSNNVSATVDALENKMFSS